MGRLVRRFMVRVMGREFYGKIGRFVVSFMWGLMGKFMVRFMERCMVRFIGRFKGMFTGMKKEARDSSLTKINKRKKLT